MIRTFDTLSVKSSYTINFDDLSPELKQVVFKGVTDGLENAATIKERKKNEKNVYTLGSTCRVFRAICIKQPNPQEPPAALEKLREKREAINLCIKKINTPSEFTPADRKRLDTITTKYPSFPTRLDQAEINQGLSTVIANKIIRLLGQPDTPTTTSEMNDIWHNLPEGISKYTITVPIYTRSFRTKDNSFPSFLRRIVTFDDLIEMRPEVFSNFDIRLMFTYKFRGISMECPQAYEACRTAIQQNDSRKLFILEDHVPDILAAVRNEMNVTS